MQVPPPSIPPHITAPVAAAPADDLDVITGVNMQLRDRTPLTNALQEGLLASGLGADFTGELEQTSLLFAPPFGYRVLRHGSEKTNPQSRSRPISSHL
jgi:hypothetical protein